MYLDRTEVKFGLNSIAVEFMRFSVIFLLYKGMKYLLAPFKFCASPGECNVNNFFIETK